MTATRTFVGAAVVSSLAMLLHESTGNGSFLAAAVTAVIVAAISARDASSGKGQLR